MVTSSGSELRELRLEEKELSWRMGGSVSYNGRALIKIEKWEAVAKALLHGLNVDRAFLVFRGPDPRKETRLITYIYIYIKCCLRQARFTAWLVASQASQIPLSSSLPSS